MSIETTLRHGLLALVGVGAFGLIAELLLEGHTAQTVQWVPFGLSAVALVGIGFALARRDRFATAAAAVIAFGGTFGVWEHLEHNYAFETEIRPTAGFAELAVAALQGASPLLAPGAYLLLGAMLALAVTGRSAA